MGCRRVANHQSRVLRKALVLEQAMHRWQPWLDSVLHGRTVLRFTDSQPSLQQMRNAAKKILAELNFPPCTLLELYWLTCVFSDYEVQHKKVKSYKFEELILPDWFPFPFGFKEDTHLDFKGKRIYPPEVWREADIMFWFARNPLAQIIQPESRAEYLHSYPDKDFIMVLSLNHPIIKLVKRGRPITTDIHGETFLD